MNNFELSIKLATKSELKTEKDKIIKLKTYDFSYFLGKELFGDDGFQSMFFYQPTLNTVQLKEDKSTDHVVSWKSKGVCTFKLIPLYTVFLHSLKLIG